MPNHVAHLHFLKQAGFALMAQVYHTHGTHTLSHFLRSFVTCCSTCPMQDEGMDSGLMGKWETGYHRPNRELQSTNQIRKLGVCVSEKESICVCVFKVGVACKLSGSLMATMF